MTEVFLNLTEVFPCFFLSCKANARVKLAKTGHGPHSSTLVCICVVRLFELFYVLFVCKCVLPPGDNPIAVNKYIIWQRSISLCTIVPSPKCLDGSTPHARRSSHHDLMERNPGLKIKLLFQRHIAHQLFIRIHQILYKFFKICSFEISQKTIRNLFKRFPCCFLLVT